MYRPLNLYYFNRDMSTLVPDPVFLPVSSAVNITEQLSQRLVTMLLDGPTDWLAPAVRTSFPAGTTATVEYSSGNVTVNLDHRAAAADPRRLFGMGAQLVWTLKQLPEIQEFTLRLDGEEVELPGVEDGVLQASSQEWNSVNPAGMTGSPRAYFLRDGQLWSLDVDQREALVPGAAGHGRILVEEHAVSLDETRVAGIMPDDDSVRVAPIAEDGEYTTVLQGGDYTSLSWDNNDPEKQQSGNLNTIVRLYKNLAGLPEAQFRVQPSHIILNNSLTSTNGLSPINFIEARMNVSQDKSEVVLILIVEALK